jgi:dihydrofolate reductase
MTRVRVHNLAMSIDGFVAGPGQALDTPLGLGGERLHTWVFATAFGRRMMGLTGGTDGVDNTFLEAGVEGIGATVMGRNMFGPVRGSWPDESWTGWWGPEPPYHHPVFVLTHHARPPLTMAGGTTFTFVTEGPAVALDMATDAADGRDVRIGGGAATVRAYVEAGRVDYLHLAVVPTLLGSGERLFDGTPDQLDGFGRVDVTASEGVAHVVFQRHAAP